MSWIHILLIQSQDLTIFDSALFFIHYNFLLTCSSGFASSVLHGLVKHWSIMSLRVCLLQRMSSQVHAFSGCALSKQPASLSTLPCILSFDKQTSGCDSLAVLKICDSTFSVCPVDLKSLLTTNIDLVDLTASLEILPFLFPSFSAS